LENISERLARRCCSRARVAEADAVVEQRQAIRRQAVAVAQLKSEPWPDARGVDHHHAGPRMEDAVAAFSTSGCSSRLGTRASNASGCTWTRTPGASRTGSLDIEILCSI
jgi:hypothetical protein